MDGSLNSQLVEADERLSRVISHFYAVQQSAKEPPLAQQMLPNYEMILVFNFGPAMPFQLGNDVYTIRQTAILGPLRNMLRYTLLPGDDLLVVNFTLDGFYRLIGKPMQQISAVDWHKEDGLFDLPYFRDLWEQLAALNSLTDRLQHISRYAFANLIPVDAAGRSLLDSIPYFRTAAVDPVKGVAATNQVSPRIIQRRFRTHLGYSAKEMVRFLRFKQVVSFLAQQPSEPVDWLAIVLRFGYHDHSHLISDFNYFVGISPRRFLRQLGEGSVCISQQGKFY
ncbi:AraC family transcriptional regulator [Spirosoma rigui]|uniref:AraC family transcriptional regulator n=1 Tax=Spirosoma rigui TaxID=564064 RepID=UPI0009AFD574|nr:helix-turn-helix domain-containing protein [Spirosoma rigui]